MDSRYSGKKMQRGSDMYFKQFKQEINGDKKRIREVDE
jgi:hypothetical protein